MRHFNFFAQKLSLQYLSLMRIEILFVVWIEQILK